MSGTEHELNARLDELLQSSRHLRERLAAEQEALKAGDALELTNATREKQVTLERVAQLDAEFKRSLEAAGLGSDGDPFTFLRAHADTDPHLAHQLNALVELVTECRQLNQENSSLVAVGMRQTAHALNFLRGIARDEADSSYGPTGRANSPVAGNEIARA